VDRFWLKYIAGKFFPNLSKGAINTDNTAGSSHKKQLLKCDAVQPGKNLLNIRGTYCLHLQDQRVCQASRVVL
jgi:hypothetical protein